MLLFIWLNIDSCVHVCARAVLGGAVLGGAALGGAVWWGELCGGELWGGAVWWGAVWGELCGGSCVSSVPPGGPHTLLLLPALDGRRDQTCPTEQRYTNCQLVRPLLVTILSYYSVYCTVHQCVLSHTYIYTYTKAFRLNLVDSIVVCVAVHLLQDLL